MEAGVALREAQERVRARLAALRTHFARAKVEATLAELRPSLLQMAPP